MFFHKIEELYNIKILFLPQSSIYIFAKFKFQGFFNGLQYYWQQRKLTADYYKICVNLIEIWIYYSLFITLKPCLNWDFWKHINTFSSDRTPYSGYIELELNSNRTYLNNSTNMWNINRVYSKLTFINLVLLYLSDYGVGFNTEGNLYGNPTTLSPVILSE